MNLTKFFHQHPVGAKVIESHSLKDVNSKFFSKFPLKEAAEYLKRFICG